MIHIPNLTALRYDGEEPQRFKHLMGVRSFPMLSKGDIILVPPLTAHQLRKKTEFVIVDLNEVLGGGVIVVASTDDGTQEGDNAPVVDGTQEGDNAPVVDGTQEGDNAPVVDGTQEESKAPTQEAKKTSQKPRGKH